MRESDYRGCYCSTEYGPWMMEVCPPMHVRGSRVRLHHEFMINPTLLKDPIVSIPESTLPKHASTVAVICTVARYRSSILAPMHHHMVGISSSRPKSVETREEASICSLETRQYQNPISARQIFHRRCSVIAPTF